MAYKILLLSKRACPYIQEVVLLQTIRIKTPDKYYLKNLERVMKYIRANPNLPLTLEENNTHVVKGWVDAAFLVHPDMKSHTGPIILLGKGFVYSTSICQKINTKIPTESELVGVDDVMTMVLGAIYYIASQGYKVDGSEMFQDNQSTIPLDTNGRNPSGKRTRHIIANYLFVSNRTKCG